MKVNQKLATTFLLISCLVLTISGISRAQRIVNIAPTEFGILNKMIDGDTTETGERVDLNTVYVLERGPLAYYVLNGSIENRFPLTIVAADGPGERPKLVPGVVEGGESARAFVPRADLTLKGLYVTNKDQAGGVNKNTLRIKASDVRITAEDCHFDYDTQSIFRLDDDHISVFLNNCIISNIASDIDNGRGIDTRGNHVDSIVVENCTFYNLSSRVLRDGGGTIEYCKFNHNTVVNTGEECFSAGEVAELNFTNNLFINPLCFGVSVNDETPNHVIETDPLIWEEFTGVTQKMDIRNNNFYLDQAVVDAYPDSVVAAAVFDSLAQVFVDRTGTMGSNITEAISFTKAPSAPVDVMLSAWAIWGGSEDPMAPFDEGDAGAFGEPGFGVCPFDFSYPEDSRSYKYSMVGQPLGDLNWFDMEIRQPSDIRYVRIAPTEFGILNKTIDGDTTATGERVDLNTVYVLERGPNAYYVLDGSIENRFPLTIVAEEGEGEMPKLVPGVVEGGESARAFVPRADLTLKGLYVTNKDQAGGINKNTLRIKASDVRIVAEDCHFDYDTQSIFRLDDDGISVILKDCIISNIASDIDNGRGIDTRGNHVNSIIVENCTFYNLSSRVLRDGGGTIRYCKFNHNTVVNTGEECFSAGQVADLSFTNNLFINPLCFGVAASDTTPNHVIETDILVYEEFAGLTQTMDIHHNNFYLDEAIANAYPDSVIAASVFDSLAQAFVDAAGTAATNISEAITFTKGPAAPVDVMLSAWAIWGGSEDPMAPFDEGDAGAFGEPGFGVVPFDFGYPQSTTSYTAATAGQPLGDLTWFGIEIIPVSVETPNDIASLPEGFMLGAAYPNPFNPTTRIKYEISTNSHVTLTIFNSIGQKIRTLVDEDRPIGRYEVSWNGTADNGVIMPSGVYFYHLSAEGFNQTRKMLLMK